MPDTPDRLSAALAERYAIERELGAGGMATVYLAEDLKHDRKVAVKVLRPELAAVLGADRFVQEIKTTAALQHPHILPLFDSGEAGGFLFYVMPYVEGETLRNKLDRETQLSIDEAVRITTEVADALDYAHRHGVVHRDIKPENILLHDGRPMVADFGIALALSAAAGGRMTETGMSLGTPHYMSPEQATADKDITGRSDIYSLASVLYEMLTGNPPHVGSSAQQIIMKIIAEDVKPVTEFRKSVPANVAAATAQALEKLPADRFDSAKAFAEALTNPSFTTATAASAAAAAPAALRRSRMTISVLAAACAVLAALAIFFGLRAGHAPAPVVARYSIAIPNLRTGAQAYGGNAIAIAPDGSRIVYVGTARNGGTQLWIRYRDDVTPRALDGTDGADGPFFSPDGRWIAYFAGGRLFKISADGGTPIALADSAATTVPGGTWMSDDHIVYTSPTFALLRVAAGGGAVETVQPAPKVLQGAPVFPAALPGSERVLLTECTNNCAQMTLIARDLHSHERHVLLQNTARAWYLPPGILIAVRQDGSVVGAPFDPRSLRLTGSAVPLLSGVGLELGVIPTFSVAENGTLVYLATDSATAEVTVMRVDRSGHATVIDPSWRANISSLALSPDGRRLAVSIQAGGRSDIWVKQLDAGPLTRITFEGTLNYRPTWRPDDRSFAFTTDRDSGFSHLYSARADGSSRPERLLADEPKQIDESQWSADGRWLVYRTGVSDGKRDIYARGFGADTARVTVSAGPFDEYMPALSPNGHWVAYVSVESGHEEVYVRPFPNADSARRQVSTAGGSQPVWAHSGRELFYVSASDSMLAVPIPATGALHPGIPKALFSTKPFLLPPFHSNFAVTPDDRDFVMLQRVSAHNETHNSDLTVVLNWLSEVRTKLQSAAR